MDVVTQKSRSDRYEDLKELWLGIVLIVGMAMIACSIFFVFVMLNAPTIDPMGRPDDFPWRTKTILNAGGLGLLYWEGAECVVDLYGTFEPLGTYEGKPVGRYTPRKAWWGWWQCPAGTLLELTWAESSEWREEVAAHQQKETEKALALQKLTEQAAQR